MTTYEKLMTLDIDTLVELNKQVVEIIKHKRDVASRIAIRSIQVGARAAYDSSRHARTITGKVLEVRQKKVVISDDTLPGQRWIIPAGALKILGDPNVPTVKGALQF